MFLLIAEFTHLFSFLHDPSLEGSVIYTIAEQFHHHPWNGLRFWDLIQPYFMFIVGVAMPYSLANRMKRGVERGDRREPRATRRQGRPEGLPIGAERRDDADAGDGDPAVVQGQFPPAGASPPATGSAASAALTASIT